MVLQVLFLLFFLRRKSKNVKLLLLPKTFQFHTFSGRHNLKSQDFLSRYMWKPICLLVYVYFLYMLIFHALFFILGTFYWHRRQSGRWRDWCVGKIRQHSKHRLCNVSTSFFPSSIQTGWTVPSLPTHTHTHEPWAMYVISTITLVKTEQLKNKKWKRSRKVQKHLQKNHPSQQISSILVLFYAQLEAKKVEVEYTTIHIIISLWKTHKRFLVSFFLFSQMSKKQWGSYIHAYLCITTTGV